MKIMQVLSDQLYVYDSQTSEIWIGDAALIGDENVDNSTVDHVPEIENSNVPG